MARFDDDDLEAEKHYVPGAACALSIDKVGSRIHCPPPYESFNSVHRGFGLPEAIPEIDVIGTYPHHLLVEK
jgi:hypothetical protein